MMKYEETKDEIKSFFLKALIVVFGLAIIATAIIVYDNSTNVPPVIREITRPDECDTKSAFKAWSSIKDKKEFANCWYDSFSYDGVVENKVSIMWIVCPRNTKGKLPDTLGTFPLTDVWPKKANMIYGYTCKWIDYSEVKTNE